MEQVLVIKELISIKGVCQYLGLYLGTHGDNNRYESYLKARNWLNSHNIHKVKGYQKWKRSEVIEAIRRDNG